MFFVFYLFLFLQKFYFIQMEYKKDEYYSVKQLAEILQVKKSTIVSYLFRNQIAPSAKRGGLSFYNIEILDKLKSYFGIWN